jgi:lipopolysaccharide biosynthesis glycosyltransferase
MQTPKISIIIPVYNAEKYLNKCIDSIINQTLKEIEILCVNDGSTDSSLDILKEYQKKDSRLKVFTQENSGPARARNVGLENATGKYIMFCDSDDWYELTMCEEMHGRIEKENVDVVMCNTNMIGIQYGNYTFPIERGKYVIDDNIKFSINVWLWNKIFRKSIIDKYKISFIDGYKCDDNLFVYEYFAVASNLFCLDKNIYNHIYNECSIMGSYHSDKVQLKDVLDHVEILIFFYNFLIDNKLFKSNTVFFCRLCEKEISYAFFNVGIAWEKAFFDKVFLLSQKSKIQDWHDTALNIFFQNINSKNYKNDREVLSIIVKKYNNKRNRKLHIGQELPKQAFNINNIPVIFASDDNFIPYLSVAIQSLIAKSSQNNNYDIIILHENIPIERQESLSLMVAGCSNFSIRFFYMTTFVKQYGINDLMVVNHIKSAAYYRLFVGSILSHYKKIVYLDADLILETDVANLFSTDMDNKAIAATLDYHISMVTSENEFAFRGFYNYAHDTLKIKNLQSYFNSGVLLMDVEKIRTKKYEERFIEVAKINKHFFHDQNVLNSVLQNDVFMLDLAWNCQISLASLPLNYYGDDKFIIHYCSHVKPWTFTSRTLDYLWWKYARLTPFYEEILYKNLKQQFVANQSQPVINLNQLKNAMNYNKNRLQYWRYKILSKITFGKRRKSYKEKRKIFKEKRDQARNFLKN